MFWQYGQISSVREDRTVKIEQEGDRRMSNIKLFESKQIRSVWDAKAQKWYFAIVDVIAVLTESADPGAYWRKLKERLKKEGNETVTNCHGLKMTAADGKKRAD